MRSGNIKPQHQQFVIINIIFKYCLCTKYKENIYDVSYTLLFNVHTTPIRTVITLISYEKTEAEMVEQSIQDLKARTRKLIFNPRHMGFRAL